MENQLAIIIKESQLESTKAKYILDNFQNYFEIASEWELKAKAIKVTNEKQETEMEMARIGRLFLRQKRLDVENARKKLKEESLRESKAIDGIANVLKALIVPIEEYLEQQEKFVEIQEEKKREVRRLEIEKRMEDERLATEQAEAEKRAQIMVENERLRREAEIKEKQLADERKKQEAALAQVKAKAENEKKALEEKSRKEEEAANARLRRERESALIEKKIAEGKAIREKEKQQAKVEVERREKERLEKILKSRVKCPYCGKHFQLNKEEE